LSRKTGWYSRRGLWLQVMASFLALLSAVGAEEQRTLRRADNLTESDGYRIRLIKVESRWVGQVPLPLKVGEIYSPAKVSEAIEAVHAFLKSRENNAFELGQAGAASVLYIDRVVWADDTRQEVEVIIRAYYVRVSLYQLGDQVLPIPRAARPTAYQFVPEPLLAFNPQIGMSYDKRFGYALGAGIESDLLTVVDTLRGVLPLQTGPDRLLVKAQGAKPFEEPFYRADGGLSYSHRSAGALLESFGMQVSYRGRKEPLGDSEREQHAGRVEGNLTLRPLSRTRLLTGFGYEYGADKLRKGLIVEEDTTAHSLLPRLLGEAHLGGGFFRTAMWSEAAWLEDSGSYQRLVGRVGYAREIPIRLNQTIGAEVIAGGGAAWGDLPEHARFFGGNAPSQFLYDAPDSFGITRFPVGPLIRSFGENDAGSRSRSGRVRGGDTFWHVNVNLTFPIPPWSRPLIPNEPIDEDDPKFTLKRLLKRSVVSAKNNLASTFESQGLSPAESAAQADTIYDEITPAIGFIADQANLYAIKPLLMFDAAGLKGTGTDEDPVWLSFGGGLQLTVVTAKFEGGYMHTLTGPVRDGRGAFFFRLVFQNLF
jgi:hypothetical protein